MIRKFYDLLTFEDSQFEIGDDYEGNVIVSSENTTSLEYTIPKLANTGNYNITVTNLGNENILASQASYIFHVDSTNNVEIIVDDEYYGRELLVIVIAEADGYYTVDINGTELTIEVVDGIGFDDTLQLPAGDYYANVTYDNPFYENNIENTTFTIYKAESNIQITELGNIEKGKDNALQFYDDYPTIFNVTIKINYLFPQFKISRRCGYITVTHFIILFKFINVHSTGRGNFIAMGIIGNIVIYISNSHCDSENSNKSSHK